jgi:DNA-binding LacI/PurR family transcriptional regulator
MVDIARLAGVSMATASRALSGSAGVAPATRERVRAFAEQLSYVVSPEASRLARGITGRVAVVVPQISRWFFGAVLDGLQSVLGDADLDVVLYQVSRARDRRRFFELLPARRQVDAVVVLALPIHERERERLELMGVTIIAAGGRSASYPYICIDDYAAGRQAVDHLLFLGHRRIGMIAAIDPGEPDWPGTARRRDAYHAALRDAHIRGDEDLVVTVGSNGARATEAMERLLSLAQPPTAVYAWSDECALGAIRTLRRAGLDVPGDLSVIGIDDHPLAELTDLSTVRQPARQQGVLAARMLLGLLSGEDVDRAVTLPTQLVLRGSTAPPRG